MGSQGQHDGEHGEDDYSPRGSRSFKRGDPPVNADSKYYCDFSPECGGQTFDRKCEWSKHMDKHDRPYRCPHAQCAKLQGFTYSGGLLRHEREVHGKHGGPKAQLMCPHDDCKRHTGKGFTRKENLNEHVRRVHDNAKASSTEQQDAAFKAGLQEAIAGAEHNLENAAEIPMSSRLPYPESAPEQYIPETAEMVKRRRIEDEPSAADDAEELKNEITRLRLESEEKDQRLRRMETNEAQLELRIRQLEDVLNAMQPPQPTREADGRVDSQVHASAE